MSIVDVVAIVATAQVVIAVTGLGCTLAAWMSWLDHLALARLSPDRIHAAADDAREQLARENGH